MSNVQTDLKCLHFERAGYCLDVLSVDATDYFRCDLQLRDYNAEIRGEGCFDVILYNVGNCM